ncbi:MAG TPA: hypothetical protein VHQ94_13715 [Pyrinomonadaceae bacterium]|jgi:hypothetical protein|nr:hypothetical protein [Pyrinomonadaceae bacterium]
MPRIRRAVRSVSPFVNGLAGAAVKAVATSVALGAVVVAVMHYMGLPVPSGHDLLGGLSRLVRGLS